VPVQRVLNRSPEEVFTVLQDGSLYPLWVVGASRMWSVDGGWPAPATSCITVRGMPAADQRHHRGSGDGVRSPAFSWRREAGRLAVLGWRSRSRQLATAPESPSQRMSRTARHGWFLSRCAWPASTYATTRRCAGLLSSLKAATDLDAPALSSPPAVGNWVNSISGRFTYVAT
jgi:hypothetical protein